MTAVDEHVAAAGHLAARLAALGNDPEAISATLLAAGAFGHRRSAETCPVARYLLDDDGAPLGWVSVGPSWVTAGLPGGTQEHVRTPPAVHAWLTAFDSGSYPQLICGGTR